MRLKLTLPESTVLVYYLVKLAGLAPITLKNNRFYPPSLPGKLYPLFVATGYLFLVSVTFTPAMSSFYTENYSPFMKIWGTISYLTSNLSILFTLIVFLFMHKKILYVMNKLFVLSNDLKSLGIAVNHEKLFRDIFGTAVMANTILVTTCGILISMEPNWPLYLSIKYCIDSWIGLNTVLIFVKILACIRQSFILVNRKLYELFTPDPDLERYHHDSRISFACMNVGEKSQSGRKGLTDIEGLMKIESLHLELCDLMDVTIDLFAIPVILNSFRLSAQLTLASYWIYSCFQNPSFFTIGSILCTLLKMTVSIVLLFAIVDASAMTGKQANATRAVLVKVWIKFRPAKLTNEFLTFSIQLLHTPVAVSVFGFINLDYSFLFKIFSAMITYLIVMIQFEK